MCDKHGPLTTSARLLRVSPIRTATDRDTNSLHPRPIRRLRIIMSPILTSIRFSCTWKRIEGRTGIQSSARFTAPHCGIKGAPKPHDDMDI
jgi:hypothetical protein